METLEQNGVMNIWSHFIQTLKEVGLLFVFSKRKYILILLFQEHQKQLIDFALGLSNTELQSYTVEVCKLECINASDKDVGIRIWNMTIKNYKENFVGLQEEWDEIFASDLDSTLEAINN